MRRTKKTKDILSKLEIGTSVAERDEGLDAYFVETQIYKDFEKGKHDIIFGDKGSGKSAIYRATIRKTRPASSKFVLVPAFNEKGSSIFQRFTEVGPLDNHQFQELWKLYFFAVLGNTLLDNKIVPAGIFEEELRNSLERHSLRQHEFTFDSLWNLITKVLSKVRSASAGSVSISLEAAGAQADNPFTPDHGLAIVNKTLQSLHKTAWIMLDRLDEAFAGNPQREVEALKALLQVYLHIGQYEAIHPKIFIRNDLFRRIARAGFVNLTHVNARSIKIEWFDADLHALLCKRIRENKSFLSDLGLSKRSTDADIFNTVFPSQVDGGDRKPTTWRWILGRIRDGNGVMPPRNLIDLVNNAKNAQMRSEERSPRAFEVGQNLIEPDSLRQGLRRLSEDRVSDTLIAESKSYTEHIEKFRDSNSEHNRRSLSELLGLDGKRLDDVIRELVDLGFLEETGENFKVPILYRYGLNITQRKAFEEE